MSTNKIKPFHWYHNLHRMQIGKFFATICLVILTFISFFTNIGINIPLLILSIFGGVITFLLIIKKPAYGVYLILLSTILLSGLPRGVIPLLRLNEAVLLFVIISICIMTVLKITKSDQKVRFYWSIIDIAFLVYFFTAGLLPFITFTSRSRSIPNIEVVFKLFSIIQFYLIYRIIFTSIKSEKQIKTALSLLIFGAIILSIIAMLQVLNLFGVRDILNNYFLTVNRFDGSMFRDTTFQSDPRAFSLLGNIHATGGFLACIILLGMIRWSKRPSNISSLQRLGVIMAGVGLALTVSFVSFIAFTTTFIITMRAKAIRMIIILLIVLIILAFIPAFQDIISGRLARQFSNPNILDVKEYIPFTIIPPQFYPTSLVFRFHIWQNIIVPSLKGHLLVGLSPIVREETQWVTTESYYIFLVFKGGIIALLGYIISIWLIFRHLHGINNDPKNHRILSGKLAQGTILIILVILIMNLTTGAMEFSGLAELPWILLGLTEAALVKSI